MGTFLLLLLIFFVIWPLVRVLLAVSRTRRQMREMFGGATGGRRASQRQSQREPEPQPKTTRKKIDPNVGEYVAFEEVESETASTDSSGYRTATYKKESQIVDVSWEDLPPEK